MLIWAAEVTRDRNAAKLAFLDLIRKFVFLLVNAPGK
jgi:hypothetical protein